MYKKVAINEVIKSFTLAQRKAVALRVFYDKRSNGNRGRCLKCDIPEFALEAGDRVEPSRTLLDIVNFEKVPGTLIAISIWFQEQPQVMKPMETVSYG